MNESNQPAPPAQPAREFNKFDSAKPAADLPNNPSQPGHPNYPAPDTRNIQPPPAQPAYPSLPGMPISDAEHAKLKASREAREQKYVAIRKMAAELGLTINGIPGPVSLPHTPSQYLMRGGRPSGLTLDQEIANERFLDDTERNTLHREEEIKKSVEAAERTDALLKKELEREGKRTNNG